MKGSVPFIRLLQQGRNGTMETRIDVVAKGWRIAATAGLLALVPGVLSLGDAHALPVPFKAEPIEFTLVDQDTGEPIEGATATAFWQYRAGWEGGGHGQIVNVLESVSRKDGKIRFPGWGPVVVDAWSRLRETTVFIFKSGYTPMGASNAPTLTSAENYKQQGFLYNGLNVRMKQFPGSRKDYEMRVSMFSYNLMGRTEILGVPSARNGCEWKRFPLMIKAFMAEEERLRAENVVTGLMPSALRAAESYYVKEGCGSPTSFLEGLR